MKFDVSGVETLRKHLRSFTQKRNCAVLILFGLLGGCGRIGRHVPGSTLANDALKRDVIRNISRIEKGLSLVGNDVKDPKTGVPVGEGFLPYGMFTIVDTSVVTPPSEQTNGQWLEKWKINRFGATATYTITFTPDGKRGTQIKIGMPPSVERKH